MSRYEWVYAGGRAGNKPSPAEKMEITATCERFIAEVLKPHRCAAPNAISPEFEAPFAHFEYVSRDRFDVSYFRHTGQWWPLDQFVTLAEALRSIETDPNLQPV